MKSSILRLLSAALLMGIALSVCVAVVSSVCKDGEERAFLWAKLLFETPEGGQRISLYDAQGSSVQTLITNKDGKAISKLLMPGSYFAVTELGCTELILHDTAHVSTTGGFGWYDGETVHLSDTEVGSLQISRPPDENSIWLDYRLTGEQITRRKVLRSAAVGDSLSFCFEGLPYGTYTLTENGSFCCRVTLSEESPDIILSLP